MDKNKRTQKTQKRFNKGNNDEEKRSLLRYEGGVEEAPQMDDMMMMEKQKSEMKEMSEKKSEKSEPKEDPEQTHCCCKYSTGMLIYGIFLWILGTFALINACILFGNIYFPIVYPLVSLLILLVYFAGLILIAIWFCSEGQAQRKGAIIGGWLILGSIIALILWNVFYILNHNKHKKEGVKVGMGDDPDDYDEEDRSSYILGYLIWGLVIIVLDILFISCAINHADTFPPEEDEMMMMMMEEKNKEEMMMEKNMEMMMDADAEMGANMEGGQRERRRAASSRSSSMRSAKSMKSKGSIQRAPSSAIQNYQAKLRNQKMAALNKSNNSQTSRGSMKQRQSSSSQKKQVITNKSK